jgi:hypothetical protein
VALGLVNAYLKRCIKKGLVKVRDAPARRYVYYLTPSGFAEKSRLTVEYLSVSFSLFRQARQDCTELLATARSSGVSRIAILGTSDLAEIAAICALDVGVTIAAVVDPEGRADRFVGVPVARSFDGVDGSAEAVLVTDINTSPKAIASIVARYGAERVLVPKLLGWRPIARPDMSP